MKTNSASFWRAIWYCFVIWIAAFFAAGIILTPLIYLILPFVVILSTIYYFKKIEKSLIGGLKLALLWFSGFLLINIIEFVGPYYARTLYFEDFENWFLYPLILLIPVIYGLISENKRLKRGKRKKLLKLTNIEKARII